MRTTNVIILKQSLAVSKGAIRLLQGSRTICGKDIKIMIEEKNG